MSNSFEFNIEIAEDLQEAINQKINIGLSIVYQAIERRVDIDFVRILSLQQLVKSQSLLLQYQEKRKNERLKQIEYNYMNAFNTYVLTRCGNDKKDTVIQLNSKDIITLHEGMTADLQQVFKIILGEAALPFRNQIKAPTAFINDFMNFWPHWHKRVREVIEMEIMQSDRIEATFESEYTFAAKILSNLRLNDRIQRFCAKIFEPVLLELETIKEELIVDFSGIYDKWSEHLAKLPALTRFLQGGEPESKTTRADIEQLYGKLKGEQQTQTLLDQMVHFERKQTAMSFLMSQVGEQEVSQGLNLRLAWLVWKKVLANRKKLQMLATGLLSCIIEGYPKIPSEVKYVVRCFKQVAEKHFGPLRFEDLKSFFNKVIFSQLFFAEFMNLYEARSQPLSNVNLTLLALVSQKIMFGQQFYERYKFGFLNPIIVQYVSAVRQFIMGFVSESIRAPPDPFFSVMLVSLQSLRFVYEVTRTKNLQSLQTVLCKCNSHMIANRSYPLKNIYITMVDRPLLNYTLILKPNDKIKRILIEFLLLIDKISEKNSIAGLFQQYRCAEEDPLSNKPSVQLYAIYLQQKLTLKNMVPLINEIEADIEKGKITIQQMKINMQKEYNYSQNLEKMYLEIWKGQRGKASRAKIEADISRLLPQTFNYQYEIIEGKICHDPESTKTRTYQQCLLDIANSFIKGFEGVDGLYSKMLEEVVDQLQKGVVPDDMVEIARSIVGQKLYSILNLNSYMSSEDHKLFKNMQKHGFITLAMLDLSYVQEEQLIIKECAKIIEELGRPCSPDRMLKIFNEITIVFQNVISINGKGSDVTADVQIPLMLVTMIRSKVRNLLTLIDFVEKFCSTDIHSSAQAQTFSCLQGVAFFIQQLDQTKLNISPEQYQQRTTANSYVIIE